MTDFTKLRIAVLATDGFEESELLEPVRALRNAGAKVEILAPPTAERSGMIQAFQHHTRTIKVPLDYYLDEPIASSDRYDGVVLPGGALNADQMRCVPQVLKLVQEIQGEDKPIAAICHAAWILISAGLVRGRTLTSYHTIQDDVRNAGGHWVDQSVVVNGNWVTSRQPDDLPDFIRETIELIFRTQPMFSEEARANIARSRIA